jgi:penicillin-binding protein 1A
LQSGGHIKSGGSTITMQVAKNFFLSPEKSFARKITEILLALQIERELSKDEILELYVNKIYLGNRSYGIEAAAQVYYGKSIRDVSLAQMATIAGLPKAPSSFNRLDSRAHAQTGQN